MPTPMGNAAEMHRAEFFGAIRHSAAIRGIEGPCAIHNERPRQNFFRRVNSFLFMYPTKSQKKYPSPERNLELAAICGAKFMHFEWACASG